MRMRNFLTQNGPIFFRRPVNEPCFFYSCLSTYQNSKSDINLAKKVKKKVNEYWNLIGREPFLTVTWESDFYQACSLCRMSMNHNNFHFTQIPDKTNDPIFLKNSKNHIVGPFEVIFAQWRSFPQNLAVTHNYIWAPNIMLTFRKN